MKKAFLFTLAFAGLAFSQTGIQVAKTDKLRAAAGETEIGRNMYFKVFSTGRTVNGNPEYRAAGRTSMVHYLEDPFQAPKGKDDWKEIDLTIVETPDKTWDAENRTNDSKTMFWNERTVDGKKYKYVARYERAGQWMQMAPVRLYWENGSGERQEIKMAKTKTLAIDNAAHQVRYEGIWGDGTEFRYNLLPNEFMKTVVFRDRDALKECTLEDKAGLKLCLEMAFSWGPGCSPAIGFASGIDVSKFGAISDTTEKKTPAGAFAFQDGQNRNVWWFQPPKIWDAYREHTEKIGYKMVRSGGAVEIIFMAPAEIFDRDDWTYPIFMDSDTYGQQISVSANDARNYGSTHPGDGNYADNSTWDYLGAAATPRFYIQGWRFTAVPCLRGATITVAHISAECYSEVDDMEVDMFGEDVDDAAIFSSGTHEPYDSWVARTTAYETVGIPDGYVSPGTRYDLAIEDVVAEIVGRAGWVHGNDIALVCVNHSTSAGAHRIGWYTYDYSGNTHGAEVDITYSGGSEGWAHTVNGVAGASISNVSGVAAASVYSVNALP